MFGLICSKLNSKFKKIILYVIVHFQSDRQGSTFPSILDLIKLLTKCEREELCDSKSSPYYIIDSKSLQPTKVRGHVLFSFLIYI